MAQHTRRHALGLIAGAALTLALSTVGASGQKPVPADLAARMSGSWKLNRELSPSVPGRGGAAGPGRGGAAFMMAGAASPLQRGGGGRGGGGTDSPSSSADLPPDVLAAQAAIRDLQQIAELIAVKATADTIAITDPRGEQAYAIDNKTTRINTKGATLEVKSRWDKAAVRQEFSSPQTRLIRSWEVDQAGRLVLKVKVESLTLNSKEAKAVYDRQ